MKALDNFQIKPSAWSYYLFVSTLILNGSLTDTLLPGYSDSILQNLLVAASFGFALLCLFFQLWERSGLLFLAAAALVGAAAYVSGGQTNLLLTLLAIYLGRDTDLDLILKLTFILKLFLFCLTVSLSLIGYLPGAYVLLGGIAEKGATLGYAHSNTFAATAGFLLLLYAAINRYRLNIFRLGLILAIEILIFRLTRSRTGVIVLGLFCVCCLLVSWKPIKQLGLRLSGLILPAILLLNFGMILWAMRSPSDLLYRVDNSLFNGRMVLSGIYLNVYPLTLFGTYLDESLIAKVSYYYALDNGYTIILLHYGLVGFTAYYLSWQLIIRYLAKKQEIILVLIALCFSLWMIYEGIVLTVPGNFIFLLLGKTIMPQNKTKLRFAW